MARYLVYTSPARGHLYPLVSTLIELRDRGHDVHIRTLASEVDALRALGLQAEPIAAEIEDTPLRDFEGSSPQEALGKALETFAIRATHEVPDLRAAIAGVRPDALLIDITTIGAAAAAEAFDMPWAQWIPLLQRFSFDPSLPPQVTLVPFGIAPEPGLEVLNAPRAAVGLAPINDTDDMWRAPLHLYYTAPPFELDLEFPASFRFVGPGVWEPPASEPEWLAEVDRPLILVGASSERQRDAALIQTALEAFGDREVTLAVSTAAHDPDGFDVPANARVERWLPHGALVALAACVVCHGGMGITQKALAAGVPLCVVPFGRDQFEVAARVAAVRAGTVVMPDALGVESLRAAVDEATSLRAGAQAMAAAFAATGGAAAAATALETQLSSVGVSA